MRRCAESVKELLDILDHKAIRKYNTPVYGGKDTIRILHVVSVCRLQLMEVDAIILYDDGIVQPDYSNDFVLANRDINTIRAKIGLLGDNYHFELLDLHDLYSSAREFLAEHPP